MKKFSLALIAAAAFTGSAIAADLPAGTYTKAPAVVAPVATWTGCYVGGNVGGGWNTFSAIAENPVSSNIGSDNGSGFIGGGQVGCDWQFPNSSFVAGIQGMVDGSLIKGSGATPGDNFTGSLVTSDTVPWFATLTGRIGYAITPSALIYAKGGAAFARDNYTIATTTGVYRSNYTATGWTAGGGLEYVFAPRWSVFVEYDYMGFGTRSTTLTTVIGPVPPNPGISVTQNVQMAIVGINFRF